MILKKKLLVFRSNEGVESGGIAQGV